MKIPLCAVFEDHWVNLRGDKYVDPTGGNPAFSEPMKVFKSYGGQPTDDDRYHRVWTAQYHPADVESDECGRTLIVSPGDGARATLIYFPDDQHEVELAEDDFDEDDFDDFN